MRAVVLIAAALGPACVFTPPGATGPVPEDASIADLAPPIDLGFVDAGVDAGGNDALVMDAIAIDTGEPDSGRLFPYTPSNFTPQAIATFGGDAVLDCGITTLNSSTNVLNNWCGEQPSISVVPQNGGPDVVIVALRSLIIEGGSTLRAGGNRPVIFAVLGDVTIDGALTSDGTGITSGAGASIPQFCAESTGKNGMQSGDNGGGGGGGGCGAEGGDGGAGAASAARGDRGVVLGGEEIIPLRGGCNGGRGGPSFLGPGGPGGGGGGGVQISAARTLLVRGTISARGGGGRGGSGRDGGGGGGSGGQILLEADRIEIRGSTTAIAANGGGGGEGGTSVGTMGASGVEGRTDRTAASGGSGSMSGGDGGAGGIAGANAGGGQNGVSGNGGGGGGGGATGRVRLNAGACVISGGPIITPEASSNGAPGCP